MTGIKLSILSVESFVEDMLANASLSPDLTFSLGSQFSSFFYHSPKVMETLGSLCAQLALAHQDREKLHLALDYFNRSSQPLTLKHNLLAQAVALGMLIENPYSGTVVPHFLPLITFSITSGKRWDLFSKTMDAFLAHCFDHHLVHQWLCVDDNSCSDDRSRMQQRFPFMHFIWKEEQNKGHAKSMQMITQYCTTPYLVHFEDDRQLIDPGAYLAKMMHILMSQPHLGQICFNENYMETPGDLIAGGHPKECDGLAFIEHEYCPTEEEKTGFLNKYGYVANCHYYPHFSLSPSMIKTAIFKQVAFQDQECFEFQFGLRYTEQGYKTAFLPGFHVLHTGRLTKERSDVGRLNAYDLLGTTQFYTIPKFKSFMINLIRRPDRWEKMEAQKSWLPPDLIRFPAVDGQELTWTPRLASLCAHNDYHMRPGVIGCALSHLQLMVQLVQDPDAEAYLIFEDDLAITSQDLFMPKVRRMLSTLDHRAPCIVFFTTVLQPEIDLDDDHQTLVRVFNRDDIYTKSIGGTGCYYISKMASQLVLDHVHRQGLHVAIDAILFRLVQQVHMYFALPPLLSQQADPCSNIQHDHQTVSPLLAPFEKYCQENGTPEPWLYNEQGQVDLCVEVK